MQKIIITIGANLFLFIIRCLLIFCIYRFYKQPIHFYDVLIMLGFVTLWGIEGALNGIYVHTDK